MTSAVVIALHALVNALPRCQECETVATWNIPARLGGRLVCDSHKDDDSIWTYEPLPWTEPLRNLLVSLRNIP